MTLQKSVLNPHQKTWTKITENVLSFFFSFLLEDRAYALMHSVHGSVCPFEFLAAKSKFKKKHFFTGKQLSAGLHILSGRGDPTIIKHAR